MIYDFEMLQKFYSNLSIKIDFAREQLKRPMALAEKVLVEGNYSLHEYAKGGYDRFAKPL